MDLKRINISRFFIFTLPIWFLNLIVIKLLPSGFYYKIALYFSDDKIINPGVIERLINHIFKFNIGLAFAHIFITLYLLINFKSIYYSIADKFEKFADYININKSNVVFAISLIFLSYTILSIFYIVNVDVGADEGYYISSIKNFYQNGYFGLEQNNFAEFRNQGLLYPFFGLKFVVNFNIYLPRILNIVYSLAFLIILLFYFYKNYSIKIYLVFLLLLVFDRTYFFVASSAFIEPSAMLFLFTGAYFYFIKNKENLSIPFFALAGLSKLQIMPILLISFLFIAVFNENEKSEKGKEIIFLSKIILLWIVGAVIFTFLQGYDFRDIILSLFRISHSSGEIVYSLPFFNRLSHFNNFFNLFNVTIFSFVLCYYIKNFKKIKPFERFLFIFAVFNITWWILSFYSISPRHVIYGVVINYFLFSIAVYRIYKSIAQTELKNILIGFLSLFLIFNFLNNFVFHAIQIRTGISDEILLAINGYREPFGDCKDAIKSGQKKFYDFINDNLKGEKNYCIAAGCNKVLFTNIEFKHPPKNFIKDNTIPKGSYFLLTFIDYKNKYVTDELEIFLNNNAELIFKKNFYEIYKITK